jgi:hypothetical protein
MVQHQGIDVYLAPLGNPDGRYREYAAPVDSPVYTGDPNEVWIEAVDGERFVIVVDLLNGFDRRGSKALQIHRRVNDDWYSSVQGYWLLRRPVPDGVDLQGRETRDTEARKVDGRWVKCGYAFGRLEIGILCSNRSRYSKFSSTD